MCYNIGNVLHQTTVSFNFYSLGTLFVNSIWSLKFQLIYENVLVYRRSKYECMKDETQFSPFQTVFSIPFFTYLVRNWFRVLNGRNIIWYSQEQIHTVFTSSSCSWSLLEIASQIKKKISSLWYMNAYCLEINNQLIPSLGKNKEHNSTSGSSVKTARIN